MASVDVPLKRLRFGQTARKDAWWVMPLVTFVVFTSFVVYVTWALLQGENYWSGNYLSPLYSPRIPKPDWFPLSPAFLILLPPVLFRATCYYYRKAYYRSFFLDPPACAVGDLRGHGYRGETAFPLILQNLHRYIFYITLLYLPFLWIDVAHATIFDGHFGIGLGTLVLLANSTALTLYSFSCHSARHLVGGRLDCFSCTAGTRARHKIWEGASVLNARHMLFAWTSFITVTGADLYVRLVATGVIRDLRLL